jgi:C4-dicarboxylate-specific signal transduction histidine kinase
VSPLQRNSDALAHELANLLDGSLRHLSLAITSLREPVRAEETSEDLLKRLEAANGAMQHMAELIHRWMASPLAPGELFQHTRTLGETIEHAVKLLSPAAALWRVEILVTLQRGAAMLPAGPVYPIIANAIRNSLEAINRPQADDDLPRTIEVCGRVRDEQLEITVSDTGPGLDSSLLDASGRFLFGVTTKRDGHGLGLQLSREIAVSLGGELQLANRSPRGAVLTLRYPVQSMGADS